MFLESAKDSQFYTFVYSISKLVKSSLYYKHEGLLKDFWGGILLVLSLVNLPEFS